MSIASHALTALHHPRIIDKTPEQFNKGYKKDSYDYTAPDPERMAQLDMEDAYWLMDSKGIKHFPKASHLLETFQSALGIRCVPTRTASAPCTFSPSTRRSPSPSASGDAPGQAHSKPLTRWLH